MDEVVPGAFPIGKAVDRVPERRHVGPERIFRQGAPASTGISMTRTVRPGDDLRLRKSARTVKTSVSYP